VTVLLDESIPAGTESALMATADVSSKLGGIYFCRDKKPGAADGAASILYLNGNGVLAVEASDLFRATQTLKRSGFDLGASKVGFRQARPTMIKGAFKAVVEFFVEVFVGGARLVISVFAIVSVMPGFEPDQAEIQKSILSALESGTSPDAAVSDMLVGIKQSIARDWAHEVDVVFSLDDSYAAELPNRKRSLG
jgi:hypothetical protein